MSFTCPALCRVSQCTPAYTNAVAHSSTYEYCSFIFWGNITSKCRFGVVAISTLTAEIVCTVTFTSKRVSYLADTETFKVSAANSFYIHSIAGELQLQSMSPNLHCLYLNTSHVCCYCLCLSWNMNHVGNPQRQWQKWFSTGSTCTISSDVFINLTVQSK